MLLCSSRTPGRSRGCSTDRHLGYWCNSLHYVSPSQVSGETARGGGGSSNKPCAPPQIHPEINLVPMLQHSLRGARCPSISYPFKGNRVFCAPHPRRLSGEYPESSEGTRDLQKGLRKGLIRLSRCYAGLSGGAVAFLQSSLCAQPW